MAIWVLAGMLLLLGMPLPAGAQEEVASAIRRYKDREASTGFYEEYEVLPRHKRPFVEIPNLRKGRFPYSPSTPTVRQRARRADAHQGIKFYEVRRCEECHVEQTRDIHTVRANLTCRQCHGGEPMASINFYYSPMNPIRRHAYVCAKCHEGASASYAAYIIHEPMPGSAQAKKAFPLLYYAYWFMLVLLLGTLAFFIPHSLLTGVRELFRKKGEHRNADNDAH
ncbi:MAG: hypothetical protein C4519_23975 [Desulfobacteraceae bacterium]|nr:MAG: hypothetical protein C4519_23975 [Desulfobacteraceae bacterium]